MALVLRILIFDIRINILLAIRLDNVARIISDPDLSRCVSSMSLVEDLRADLRACRMSSSVAATLAGDDVALGLAKFSDGGSAARHNASVVDGILADALSPLLVAAVVASRVRHGALLARLRNHASVLGR